jgi:flagellar biosynthesis protein FlhG
MLEDSEGTQAAGLARMTRPRPVKVIAVTGGKGGVGKTNATINLGLALIERGREVMILDADFGLANVDVLLGLQPRFNLGHVLSGECGLEDVVIEGPKGLQVVPASSGMRRMANLSPREHGGIIHAFSELYHNIDVLLIDTAAGISDSVLTYTYAAHHVVVVVCDEPASITDAYALMKVLSREHGVNRFQILSNQTRTAGEGRDLYGKIARVCDRFLDVTLEFLGAVPHDEYVRRAIQQQSAVVDAFPGSLASQAFKELAARADKWPAPAGARGHVEFFIERLVQGDPDTADPFAAKGVQ